MQDSATNYTPFYTNTNNGTIAIVTRKVWADIEIFHKFAATERGQLCETDRPAIPGPIFTFSDNPRKREFATGDMELWKKLQAFFHRTHFYTVEMRDLYVPFSNGFEIHPSDAVARAVERTFRTTLVEFEEAFPGFKASEPLVR